MTTLSIPRVRSWRALWTRAEPYTPPALAALFSWVHMLLVASLSGHNLFSPTKAESLLHTDPLIKWDATLYLSIAQEGYNAYPCSFNAEMICGNTAWMPMYPMLARILSAFGIPYELGGLIVSLAALVGCFVFLWKLLGSQNTPRNILILAAAAVFPGSVYFHAWFPMSLAVLGVFITVWGVKRELWWLAGLGALVAIASHSAGNVVIIALLFSPLFAWRSVTVLKRWLYGFGAAALGGLGFVWSIWLMWQATGNWSQYWDHQSSSYGAGIHSPWGGIAETLTGGDIPEYFAVDLTALQVASIPAPRYTLMIVLIFAAVVSAATLSRWVRGWRASLAETKTLTWQRAVNSLEPLDWLLLAYGIGVFFIPFVAGEFVSQYRTHALLLPCLYLARDAFRAVQFTLVPVFAWGTTLLTAAFFTGWLV